MKISNTNDEQKGGHNYRIGGVASLQTQHEALVRNKGAQER